jgi:MFS family permease
MHSNIKKLITGKFLTELYFAVPIQTFFLLDKGLNFAQVALLESVLLVTATVFEIPTGFLGDKFGRKWSIVISNILKIIAWIPWFFADSIILFALSFFLFGISQAFFSGADQSLIYDQLKSEKKEEKMQKIFGFYNGSYIMATAIGALVGSLISNKGTLEEYYFLYMMILVSQILGLIVFLFLKEPKREESMELGYKPNELLKGFRHIFNSPNLFNLFLLYIFTLPLSLILLRVQQPYLQNFNIDNFWYGGSIFVSSIIIFFLKVFAYKLEEIFNRDLALFISTILPGLFWMLMSLAINPATAIILFILTDVAGNIRDPIFADHLNKSIPSAIRNTTLSSISFSSSLYVGITQIIFGMIVTNYSLESGLIFVGIIITVSSISLMAKFRGQSG